MLYLFNHRRRMFNQLLYLNILRQSRQLKILFSLTFHLLFFVFKSNELSWLIYQSNPPILFRFLLRLSQLWSGQPLLVVNLFLKMFESSLQLKRFTRLDSFSRLIVGIFSFNLSTFFANIHKLGTAWRFRYNFCKLQPISLISLSMRSIRRLFIFIFLSISGRS